MAQGTKRRNAQLVEATVVLLDEARRPLSARRLMKGLEGLGFTDLPSHEAYVDLLGEAGLAGRVREVRRGVYALPVRDSERTQRGSKQGRSGGARGGRTRNRRNTSWKAKEGFPAAPTTLDETAAMSLQADTHIALSDAVLRRMRKRAQETLALPANHSGANAAAWGSGASPDDNDAADPLAPLEGYTPEVGGAPYVERRQGVVGNQGAERRQPMLSELEGGSALAKQVVEVLSIREAPMTLEALEDSLEFGGKAGAGLKAALIAENKRRKAAGLRRPFRFCDDGAIGLTSWCVSTRYLELEVEIARLAAEQREIVKRTLLTRISELDDAAFARFVLIILERLGYSDFEEVSRSQGGTVAISARQQDGDLTRVTAVVARKAWLAIDEDTVRALATNLRHFGATAGVLITVGGFTADAVRMARQSDGPTIRLVDGPGLSQLVYESGVGLAGHRFEYRYLDSEFFEGLER